MTAVLQELMALDMIQKPNKDPVVVNTMTKSNLGEKGLFYLTAYESTTEGSQGRSLEAGREAEATKEHC